MFRSTLLRGVFAGAFPFALISVPALAQEALPTIDIGAEQSRAKNGAPQSPDRRGRDSGTSYTGPQIRSALKTDIPILDTPRSVVVIPKQVLQDNQVLNVQDAVKFVSGVQTAAPFYDSYLIRGFTNGSNTYRNGLKLYSQTNTEDVSFLDRVEIVKGPAAMLYGRIQPGGLVNFVTKKPQENAEYSVQTQFGSWGLSRTTVDATGPVFKDKSLLYRVIGVFDHADDFINFRHRDNGAAQFSLAWKPTSQFEGNVQLEYYNQNTTNIGSDGQQIPAAALTYAVPGIVGRPYNLPRNWSQNDPGMYENLPSTMERVLASADWTYHINDAWKVTNRFHYNVSIEDQEYLLNSSYNAATGAITRNVSWTVFYPRQTWSTNLDVNGEFNTGPIKHNLLVGFDYYSYRSVNKGDNPSYSNPTIAAFNSFAPSYGALAWPLIQAEHAIAQGNILFRSKQDDWGYYIQDDLSYEDTIHLLLGGRYDVAFDASSEIYGVTSGYYFATGAAGSCFPACDGHYNPQWKGNKTEHKFSPNAGLLLKITPEYSIYSSFSQSFSNSNSASINFNGVPLQPEEAWQYEIGAKASLFDGRLTASVAAFDLHRTNVASTDPVHGSPYSVTAGEVRSMGVETDVAGQITDNISLIASYTYDDVIIIRDTATGTAAKLGKRWPGVPRHAGNLWAKFDTAPGQKEGWSFGAGFYANGERQGNNTNSYQLPGYVRFDAMTGYRTIFQGHPIEAQLNVVNIGDAKYFEAASGQYSYYGQPRTFIGSMKVKF